MAPYPEIGNKLEKAGDGVRDIANDTVEERTTSEAAGGGSDAQQDVQRQIDSKPAADDHGRGDDK